MACEVHSHRGLGIVEPLMASSAQRSVVIKIGVIAGEICPLIPGGHTAKRAAGSAPAIPDQPGMSRLIGRAVLPGVVVLPAVGHPWLRAHVLVQRIGMIVPLQEIGTRKSAVVALRILVTSCSTASASAMGTSAISSSWTGSRSRLP